jgi:hypothetical protein
MQDVNSTPKRKRSTFIRPVIAIISGIFLLLFAWKYADDNTPPSPPPPPSPTPIPFDVFFEQNIRPALQQFADKNDEAVKRAEKEVKKAFLSYQKGIPSFAEGMTDVLGRFSIIKGLTKDAWESWLYQSPTGKNFSTEVYKIFQVHIMSTRDLHGLFRRVNSQFQSDLQANKNLLHADIRAIIQQSELHFDSSLPVNELMDEIQHTATQRTQELAKQSVTEGLAHFMNSLIIGEIAEKMTTQLMAYIFEQLVPIIAAKTGTTIPLTTIGGATGQIIGLGVGFIVGNLIDVWMADSLKADLELKCYEFLGYLEQVILIGTPPAKPGIKVVFLKTVTLFQEGQESAIRSSLTEVYK